MPASIGQHIGTYEIVSLLGKGGMAEVYRARQMLPGGVSRNVAFKLIDARLSTLPEFIARFNREAQTLVSLSHPHILKAFDYGLSQDNAYLVMELMAGGSLADLARKGALPYPRVIRVMDQIGEALDYAHLRGIIHRDLKPQNVLLDESGNTFLTDFGIVKLLGDSTTLTQSHAVIGTPSYMSPEQGTGGTVDSRSDLYSLGVMLFELLSGKLPFTADTPVQVLFKHAYEPPPRLTTVRPDAPSALDQILAKALSKSPDDRYQTAAALATDVRAALSNESINTLRIASVSPTPAAKGQQPHLGMRTELASTPNEAFISAALPSVLPSSSTTTGANRGRYVGIGALVAIVLLVLIGGAVLATKPGIPSPTPTPSLTTAATEFTQSTAPAVAIVPTNLPTLSPTLTATLTPIPPTNTAMLTQTAGATPIPPTEVPSATLTSTLTRTPTPILTLTPLSIDDLANTADALDALTQAAALIQTATLWTITPTPNIQASTNALRTLRAIQTQAQVAINQTAVAPVWTPTTAFTPTNPFTPTDTSTLTPIATLPPLLAGMERTDRLGIRQVYVPAGCFEMGNTDPDLSAQIRGHSPRPVCLTSGYWIDKYEVSNADYQKFIDDGGYQKQEYWTPTGWQWVQANNRRGPHAYNGLTIPNQPRVGITLNESIAYGHWRGGSVPTEAEWEYAARGPNSFTYPWGNTFEPGRANINGVAGRTVDVTQYDNGQSWVGAYNMAGNAGEWVSDCFNATYDKQMVRDNPQGPCDGSNEMVKGSSYEFDQFSARSAYRFVNLPGKEWSDVGFRVISRLSK